MPDRPQDRRRAPRFSPRDQVFAEDDLRGGKLGMISNISATGMMLISDAEIPEQAAFQLRIPLHLGTQRSFVLGVESVWSEPANTMGRFWTGFRIIESDPEYKKSIESAGSELEPW